MYIYRSATVPEAETVYQMHFQMAMPLFIDLMVLISYTAVFPEKDI